MSGTLVPIQISKSWVPLCTGTEQISRSPTPESNFEINYQRPNTETGFLNLMNLLNLAFDKFTDNLRPLLYFDNTRKVLQKSVEKFNRMVNTEKDEKDEDSGMI